MSATPFDTIKLAKALQQDAALTREQADGFARALAEAFQEQLVTKQDLKTELLLLEQRMTIKLGAMQLATAGIIAAIVKLLI